jgi:hypothetical protein
LSLSGLAPPGDPRPYHEIRIARDAQEIQAKAQEPFRVQIIDYRVGQGPRIRERRGLAPRTEGLEHPGRHGVEINAREHLAPAAGDLPFELKEFVPRSALKALRIAELHHFALGNERSRQRTREIEPPGKFLLKNAHVVHVDRGLGVGGPFGERRDQLFRSARHPFAPLDLEFEIGDLFLIPLTGYSPPLSSPARSYGA